MKWVMIWALIVTWGGTGKAIERIAEYRTQAECQKWAKVFDGRMSRNVYCIEALWRGAR